MGEHCSQEPRFAQLETGLEAISETLKDVRDLLKSSIRSEERIADLQGKSGDYEKRLRKLETARASGQWIERLMWVGLTAWATGAVKFLSSGG